MTSIGDLAFNPSTLTSVTIPNSVTSIGFGAFAGCTRLTRVTIPNSVISIGDAAFSDCWALTSVTIPNSVTSIGDYAFYGCTSLTRVNVDAANSAYSSIDGVLFNKTRTTLHTYPAGKNQASYTIPNSVTSIGDAAFYNCGWLTSVTIPNSVTSIGDYAFYTCEGLTSVNIPDSVTSIGDLAFYDCPSLASVTVATANPAYTNSDGVLFDKALTTLLLYPAAKLQASYTIPNSVTSIAASAFEVCTGLTSVTIPNSVTSIGDYAFYGCTSLTNAIFLGDAPDYFGSEVFDWTTPDFTIHYSPHATGFTNPWHGYNTVADSSLPWAPTVIRISGSTTFRASTHNAISDIMDGEVYGYAGTSLGSANRAVFTGTVNGQPVTISCRWSGSVGGMLDVAQDRLASDWPRNDGTLTTAGKPNHTAVETGNSMSDIALSDTFPSSIGITGNTLFTTPIGVVPFFFVKGKSNDPAVQAVLNKITNINTNQAKVLLGSYLPASQLTGNEADLSTFLFPVGRDAQSGTRAVTYLELGVSGGTAQVTSTISGGVITNVTNTLGGGYSSNSFTATDLKTPVGVGATVDLGDGSPVEVPYGLIASIGLSDILSNNLHSQVIGYNGANIFSNVGGVWTPNYNLIYSGAYTLWAYEHILWRDTMEGTKLAFANSLKDRIAQVGTLPSGLLLSNMKVERTIEGEPIPHK